MTKLVHVIHAKSWPRASQFFLLECENFPHDLQLLRASLPLLPAGHPTSHGGGASTPSYTITKVNLSFVERSLNLRRLAADVTHYPHNLRRHARTFPTLRFVVDRQRRRRKSALRTGRAAAAFAARRRLGILSLARRKVTGERWHTYPQSTAPLVYWYSPVGYCYGATRVRRRNKLINSLATRTHKKWPFFWSTHTGSGTRSCAPTAREEMERCL